MNRIHSTGLELFINFFSRITVFDGLFVACCMLISQACFTKLTSVHIALSLFRITPHDTHTHTPHRSTVTRGRIFRKDFRREREKNSEQPRSEASIEIAYIESHGRKNKSFQAETSKNQTTPIKVRNSLRVHRRMTEIKYARNEHIPRAAE